MFRFYHCLCFIVIILITFWKNNHFQLELWLSSSNRKNWRSEKFGDSSCHRHSFSCSSTVPWNNYHNFPSFWDQFYDPLRLGLSTEVRLWSQFHILLNWKVSNFFVCLVSTKNHSFLLLGVHKESLRLLELGTWGLEPQGCWSARCASKAPAVGCWRRIASCQRSPTTLLKGNMLGGHHRVEDAVLFLTWERWESKLDRRMNLRHHGYHVTGAGR